MLSYFKNRISGDGVIWAIIFILSVFSLLSVFSASGTLAYKYHGGNAVHYLIRQGVTLIIGVLIIFVVHRIPYRYFSKLALWAYYIAVFLLLVTMLWGMTLNQASRWIMLPGGISFQTSDFAKVALMMYLARVLSVKENEIQDLKGVFRNLLMPVIIVTGLILPSDFSTAALLFGTSLVVMFIGRVKLKYLGLFIATGLVGLLLFVAVAKLSPSTSRVGTWEQRIDSFFDDESESNFQAEQSKIAIATGGFFGKGPGNSVQRNVLPHTSSDFIFAIIVEEYGYFAALFLIFLYLFLFYRVVIITRKVDKKFGAFVASSLALLLSFQAMSNMAVAVNIFPVTGQTLPFVSMGGTSIVFTSVALGIILSVSREVNENEKQKKEEIEDLQEQIEPSV